MMGWYFSIYGFWLSLWYLQTLPFPSIKDIWYDKINCFWFLPEYETGEDTHGKHNKNDIIIWHCLQYIKHMLTLEHIVYVLDSNNIYIK
jgi:hypothetical protein